MHLSVFLFGIGVLSLKLCVCVEGATGNKRPPHNVGTKRPVVNTVQNNNQCFKSTFNTKTEITLMGFVNAGQYAMSPNRQIKANAKMVLGRFQNKGYSSFRTSQGTMETFGNGDTGVRLDVQAPPGNGQMNIQLQVNTKPSKAMPRTSIAGVILPVDLAKKSPTLITVGLTASLARNKNDKTVRVWTEKITRGKTIKCTQT